jgi:hypothetical protein
MSIEKQYDEKQYWVELERYEKGLGAKIPDEDMDRIRAVYKRYRKKPICNETTRLVLKRLKLTKYTERSTQITCRMNGESPLIPSHAVAERVKTIWLRCRQLYPSCPPEIRKHRKKNMPNYPDLKKRIYLMIGEDALAGQYRQCTTKKTTEELNGIWEWFASCNEGEPDWKNWRRGILPILPRKLVTGRIKFSKRTTKEKTVVP